MPQDGLRRTTSATGADPDGGSRRQRCAGVGRRSLPPRRGAVRAGARRARPARGLRHRGRAGRGRASARAPTSATRRRRSSSPTGSATSTRSRRKDTSTLEKFQQETGITVDYKNGDVNDNETFFAKVSPQLQDCKSTGRDVFVVTDWMAARMIELGWIQKLDHANMPNVDANLIDFLKSPDWDPNRDYSVPWQSGMTGICYNSELTDPVTQLRGAAHPPRPQGQGRAAHRDARHDALPAAHGGQRPRGLHRRRVHRRDRARCRATSTAARSAASPATTTSTT